MRKFILLPLLFVCVGLTAAPSSWIRINLAGYGPNSVKVAVWCSKTNEAVSDFELLDAVSETVVYKHSAGSPYGAYGPFTQTYRLNFSAFKKEGKYFLRAGDAVSPGFEIKNAIYNGLADFSLKYMRQQRSGYNPFLKDSCHTRDGYTMDGPMPDSTHIDVSGGWHDATDYLQYAMTSANATWYLLSAARDFPGSFTDEHLANGVAGKNGQADVLDEARWGLDWLLKMHPRPDWMFNQLADDRDHKGFRLPNHDTASYGKGRERPVYFVTGEIQGLGKYKNRTKGTSSIAGKFSSAFALGYQTYKTADADYAKTLKDRALSAYAYGLKKPGNTQTACYVSPYFYEEDNWVDDMELAAADLYHLTGDQKHLNEALRYGRMEHTTPWMGIDTAGHYQWYPFINAGHRDLAQNATGSIKREAVGFYKEGIELVWNKGKQNAFFRGVPFIWCSNNLQTAFAIQCYWYRKLTGDKRYEELEQAAFDWLLGCNPWGTSMIVGMPAHADYPDDPHSSLNYLNGYQTLGALVDGPVYGTIYRKQLGVNVVHGDEYAEFQSKYIVYHDDVGDYVTNEPTMDGTAFLIYLLAAKDNENRANDKFIRDHGAVIRGAQSEKKIALVFTGDSFADGGQVIASALKKTKAKASFFFTGNFYRNDTFKPLIKQLIADQHYVGPHSDKHLLYCSWENRDSLRVSEKQFDEDLLANYAEMEKFGIHKAEAPWFIPPYEWYNDKVTEWATRLNVKMFNYTPGTLSNADYTTPAMKNYRSSDVIMQSISGKMDDMNGFILLVHIGTDPARTDKLYKQLPLLIASLKSKGYSFLRIDDLLTGL